jgi:hypothetical protein
MPRYGWIAGFLTIVFYNWLTMFGASLVTVSACLIIVFLIMGALDVVATAYLGIITFLVLPTIFVVGLLIIPAGAWLERRRRAQGKPPLEEPHGPYPTLDFNHRRTRDVAKVVLLLTVLNLLIIATISYRGVVYSESPQFCGLVCHTVMEPEWTAYLDSPHARVACVECHIGPGAPWFVRSKLSGVRQVFAVMLDTYTRPVETPVHNLRPSRETCEECHWPARFSGDRMRVIPRFLEDEENTKVYSVLLMHIGGGHGGGHGIHSWHVSPDKVTTYLATDEDRLDIAVVRVQEQDGTVREYRASGLEMTDEEIARAEFREMDCIDCHNRPTHIFQLPAPAVDGRLAAGTIDPAIPYIKRVSTEALTAAEGAQPKEADLAQIADHIRAYYQNEQPEFWAANEAVVESAIREVQDIYGRNVFPKMGVTWGTYPDHIGHPVGHADFPGCFRCHNDSHATPEGEVISQDCMICHSLLAYEEFNPEVLTQLMLE